MALHRLVASTAFTLSLALIVAASGCGSSSGDSPAASINAKDGGAKSAQNQNTPTVTEPVQIAAGAATTQTPAAAKRIGDLFPEVLIKTNLGQIRVRLNAEKAPLTVDNFLTNYCDRGFYDQTVFHYVEKGYMIAGGGFTATLQAKTPRACILNEASNGLRNQRGTIAMIRDPEHVDTANSQFFINLADNGDLDHKNAEDGKNFGYCVFGQVIEGMDVVDRIAGAAVTDKESFPKTPVEPVLIESIRRVGKS